ncbi:putative transcription factor interactor and regulator CCHC(Zn) family [Helianthus annuus]|nr:putative transcription factor interactor and regulator CCHC(Zn) family [Helianthus annuus]
MDTEFYNAFATPTTPAAIAQAMNLENETGTTQKPPRLMSIEEYYGWKDRFENWVQANHLRSWECILKKYVLPRTELQVIKQIPEFTDQERVMYKAEKMMISLLQQAIKEDIFILLQHDKTAKSIWDALKVKFEGSENMIKSKKALLKKEFDLFSSLPGEDTKKLIERYCHLVRSLSMLGVDKGREEWVDKLADALPQKEWGTYLMILKNTGVYDGLTISQFIEKIESQDLEQQKIVRMKSLLHLMKIQKVLMNFQKDLEKFQRVQMKVYRVHSPVDSNSDDEEEKHINVAKSHLSPEGFHFYFAERMEKLKEKRTAKEQQKKSEDDVQNVESVAEKITKVEKEEEKVTEVEKVIEVVKTIEVEKIVEVVKPCEKCLEACKECAAKDDIIAEYEKKKEQLLFNLNYVKESYDVLNKTVTGLQKTNTEREQALTMMNAVMMSKQKAINFYIEESAKWKQEFETEKIENERIRRLLLSYSSSDYLIDRIYPTVAGMEAFQDEKLKEKKDCGKKLTISYNKCPPPIWDGYSPRKPNEEQLEKAVNIKLKTDTTDVLPDNIDVTFTSSDTDHESELIKKVVDQVLDTDEEFESKSKSEKSNSSVNRENSSVKRSYSKEFLLSKADLNDETFEVVYTLSGSNKLYYNKEFPIMSIKTELINKTFKLIEINIPELKVLKSFEKPKKYTSRVQQRLNKKKGYNSGSGFQKKPNQNRSYKKKGLGFVPSENHKNDKNSKTKTEFVSGGSADEEQKKPFWRQSNQEFLAEKKRNGIEVCYQRETRTCYRCNEVGHIA